MSWATARDRDGWGSSSSDSLAAQEAQRHDGDSITEAVGLWARGDDDHVDQVCANGLREPVEAADVAIVYGRSERRSDGKDVAISLDDEIDLVRPGFGAEMAGASAGCLTKLRTDGATRDSKRLPRKVPSRGTRIAPPSPARRLPRVWPRRRAASPREATTGRLEGESQAGATAMAR